MPSTCGRSSAPCAPRCACSPAAIEDALAAVEDGLSIVEANGDRCFEAELYRLRGEALAQALDLAAGVDDVEKAIAIATAQGALGLERRARASLSQLHARNGPGHT